MIDTKGYGGKYTNADIMSKTVDWIAEKSSKFQKTGIYEGVYDNAIKFLFSPSETNTNSFVLKISNNTTGEELGSISNQTGNASTAKCRIRIAENNGIFVFEFASQTAVSKGNAFNVQLVLIKTGNGYYISNTGSGTLTADHADALAKGLCNDNSNIIIKKVINRLLYFYKDNKIEIIENKIIADNTDFSEMTTDMIDCSNISPQNLYEFNGKDYYAINANTLMAV